MNLLIVDDDIATIESIKLCFEIFDPSSSLDNTDKGLESIEMIKSKRYDGAIIDLGLPDIDGLKLIENIRTFSNLPVLVLSARQSPHVIESAIEKGANEYICKPFNYKDLLEKLNLLTNKKD